MADRLTQLQDCMDDVRFLVMLEETENADL